MIAPSSGGVDEAFIADFYDLVKERILIGERFVIITGGGHPARIYQEAYKKTLHAISPDREAAQKNSGQNTLENFKQNSGLAEALDRIGIAATRLNAALLREVFSDYAETHIVTNPQDEAITFEKPVLIGAGWKPGFSTDLDAVVLAERFGAARVVNISNVSKLYTADPAKDASAKPLSSATWDEIISVVGDSWSPGMNVPFDPVACRRAKNAGLEVIIVSGKNMPNLRALFAGGPFDGTRIAG